MLWPSTFTAGFTDALAISFVGHSSRYQFIASLFKTPAGLPVCSTMSSSVSFVFQRRAAGPCWTIVHQPQRGCLFIESRLDLAFCFSAARDARHVISIQRPVARRRKTKGVDGWALQAINR